MLLYDGRRYYFRSTQFLPYPLSLPSLSPITHLRIALLGCLAFDEEDDVHFLQDPVSLRLHARTALLSVAHSPTRMLGSALLVLVGCCLATSQRVLVSYAFHIPVNYQLLMHEPVHSQCRANIETFVERAVAASPLVSFVFVRMGRSLVPEALTRVIERMANVQLEDFPSPDALMQAHALAMESHLASKDYFILLHCSARGPYHSSIRLVFSKKNSPRQRMPEPSTAWVGSMTSPLRGSVKAVGATVSCEVSPHVQGYAMALSKEAARLLYDFWRPSSGSSSGSAEVEGSKLLLSRGMGIAGLDSRYGDADFLSGEVCPRVSANAGHLLNPTACYPGENSLGCSGVDPCEVVFVKYGDDVLLNGLIPLATRQRVQEEDEGSTSQGNFCSEMAGTVRPDWNVSMISRQVLTRTENSGLGQGRLGQLVILVRAHSGYRDHLNMMLEFLSTLPQVSNISVLILPTEWGSHALLQEVSQRHIEKVDSHTIFIPEEVFVDFEPYLSSICSKKYSQYMERIGRKRAVSRYCGVNSPVHYLLVDIALHAIKLSSPADAKLLVTNADNFYSPRFFTYVFKHVTADVFMVNMVSRGKTFDTKPIIGQVDLGAYVTSLDFLKRLDIFFLNSLPSRVLPHHYHDADGHFLQSIISKGGNLMKTAEYLFFHN